jgi:hypothetical protein
VNDAVHNETGITVNKDLTIQGRGAASTVVSGGAGLQVFAASAGVTATIRDITVGNGSRCCPSSLQEAVV